MTDGPYRRRLIDDELDLLLPALPAIALDGPKAVGKTATASRRARSVIRLDDEDERRIIHASPERLTAAQPPTLIDEWQKYPPAWDRVRRAVDDGAPLGSFILTGSASPAQPPAHTGAGRIARLRMRPLALSERDLPDPTVSLAALLNADADPIGGSTRLTLDDYVEEILGSGFPSIRPLAPRARRLQLDSYLANAIDRDIPDAGHALRDPSGLRRWLAAYAAATSTTATYETIRDAATSSRGDKPSRSATLPYREVLERMWLIDPVPAWLPTRNHLARLNGAPKHQLADPALAARLLALDADTLLGRNGVGDAQMLGRLFEALVTLSVRAYAQLAEASVGHLRTQAGRHEVDLVVTRGDQRVLGIEIKLSHTVHDDDVGHLRWLRDQLGDAVADLVVITTGREAYRRRDGIAVVPAGLLGP